MASSQQPPRQPAPTQWFQNASAKPSPGGTRLSFPRQRVEKVKRFDADSGLVFNEGRVLASTKSVDWIGAFQTPSLVKRRQPNVEGAASLLDVAKAVMARNMRSINVEHLRAIPWVVGKQLWDEITASRTESFHTWRIFATAYPDQFNAPDRRCHMSILAPSLPLTDYYAGLNSRSLSYLVALRIAPNYTQTADLIRLSTIRNLSILDLSDSPSTIDHPLSTFDERILRAWADLASPSNREVASRFQNLRILLLGWQDELGFWLFKYLHVFPQLCHVIVTDCRGMQNRNKMMWLHQSRQYGWEPRSAKKSAKSLRPVIDEQGDAVIGRVSGLMYESEEILGELFGQNKEHVEKERKPVLEMWLNRPRPWTHIVDDFPGTRTVWFDKIGDVQKERREDYQAVTSTAQDNANLKTTDSLPSDRMKRAREAASSGPDSDSQQRPRKLPPRLRSSGKKGIGDVLADFL